MSRSGFVLVGGASRRMGRDKALLPLGQSTMVEQIARQVHRAAGDVTLIGSPEKYFRLGFPVVADEVENCGPIGGLLTALRVTGSEWNLLVACDMPSITEDFLKQLLDAAAGDCVVPETGGKIDPLCAVYHRRILPAVEAAIHRKLFKMQDFVSTLQTSFLRITDPSPLLNVNTPAEWSAR